MHTSWSLTVGSSSLTVSPATYVNCKKMGNATLLSSGSLKEACLPIQVCVPLTVQCADIMTQQFTFSGTYWTLHHVMALLCTMVHCTPVAGVSTWVAASMSNSSLYAHTLTMSASPCSAADYAQHAQPPLVHKWLVHTEHSLLVSQGAVEVARVWAHRAHFLHTGISPCMCTMSVGC